MHKRGKSEPIPSSRPPGGDPPFRGRHALITGAGKRLGWHIADALLAGGATVSAHYRTSAEGVRELERRHPGRVFPVPGDLLDIAGLRGIVDTALGHGPLDILVNSASDFFSTPLPVSEDHWDHFLDLNLKSPFFLAQACAASLRAQRGAVIQLVDIFGSIPLKGYAPYAIAKGGLLHATRQLAREWAPEVRVNAVSPGTVMPPENFTEEQRERVRSQVALGRIGSPADVAAAVLFLLRNEYMTGAELIVDGGKGL